MISGILVGIIGVALTLLILGILVGLLWVVVWLVSHLPSFGSVDLRLALRNLTARRIRTATTLLALSAGMFALSSITFVGVGTREILQFQLDRESRRERAGLPGAGAGLADAGAGDAQRAASGRRGRREQHAHFALQRAARSRSTVKPPVLDDRFSRPRGVRTRALST